MNIQEKLISLKDEQYANFSSNLTPNIKKESIIGVRVPILKQLAKSLSQEEITNFLSTLPHQYYDENMLHSILISNIKDKEQCLKAINNFLPYVNNWAVCDTINPQILKNKDLIKNITLWIQSPKVYTCRFGLRMLMNHYLDNNFKEEYLSLPATIISNEYYINMMISWYYATALAKQWSSTIPYLEHHQLPTWIHNKTISKALDSYRITPEQKSYLKALKKRD